MTHRLYTLQTLVRELGLPVLLGTSLTLAWFLGDTATDLLMYQRSEIQEGQIWRLLTAHWVHLSARHLFLNLTTLAVIWWLFRHTLAGATGYILTGLIALGLSLALFLLHPDVWWYAGFSGVLHGLLVAGAVLSRHQNPLLSILVVLIVFIKLTLELILGADPGLTKFINSPILSEAHLYGALLGGLGAGIVKNGHR